MIGAWLARKAGVEPLAGRIDALERDLAEARTTILSLNERMAATQERCERQLRIFARMARTGAGQLRRLQTTGAGHGDTAEALKGKLARLEAELLIVNKRIEDEAVQTRRGTTELFRRIEATRAYEETRSRADAVR